MLRFGLIKQLSPQKLKYVVINPLSTQSTQGSQSTEINPNVAGLSDKCCNIPNKPVGPNAAKDKEYKNPEYFCYNINSFAEAEVEMEKYRLPAPSNKIKFQP